MDLGVADDDDQVTFNWEESDDEDWPEPTLPDNGKLPDLAESDGESKQQEQEADEDCADDNVAIVEERRDVVVVNGSSDEEDNDDNGPDALTIAIQDNERHITIIEEILSSIDNLYSRHGMENDSDANCEVLQVDAVDEQAEVFETLNADPETEGNLTLSATPSDPINADNTPSVDSARNVRVNQSAGLFSDEVEITPFTPSHWKLPVPAEHDRNEIGSVCSANISNSTSKTANVIGEEPVIVSKGKVRNEKSLEVEYPTEEPIESSDNETEKEVLIDSVFQDIGNLAEATKLDLPDSKAAQDSAASIPSILRQRLESGRKISNDFGNKVMQNYVRNEAGISYPNQQSLPDIRNQGNIFKSATPKEPFRFELPVSINNETAVKHLAGHNNKNDARMSNETNGQQARVSSELSTSATMVTSVLNQQRPDYFTFDPKTKRLCKIVPLKEHVIGSKRHLLLVTPPAVFTKTLQDEPHQNAKPKTQAATYYMVPKDNNALHKVNAPAEDVVSQNLLCAYSREERPPSLRKDVGTRSRDSTLVVATKQSSSKAPVICSFKNCNNAISCTDGDADELHLKANSVNLCAHCVAGSKKFAHIPINVKNACISDISINFSTTQTQVSEQRTGNAVELLQKPTGDEILHVNEDRPLNSSSHPPLNQKDAKPQSKAMGTTTKTAPSKAQTNRGVIVQRYFSKTAVQFTGNSAPTSDSSSQNAKNKKVVISFAERIVQRKEDGVEIMENEKKEVTIYHNGSEQKSYMVFQNQDPDVPDLSKLDWEEWQQALSRKGQNNVTSPKSSSFPESSSCDSGAADQERHVIDASPAKCADTAPTMEFPDAIVASTARNLPHLPMKTDIKRGRPLKSARAKTARWKQARRDSTSTTDTVSDESSEFEDSGSSDWTPSSQYKVGRSRKQRKTRGRRKRTIRTESMCSSNSDHEKQELKQSLPSQAKNQESSLDTKPQSDRSETAILFAKVEELSSELQTMKQQWNSQLQALMSSQIGNTSKRGKAPEPLGRYPKRQRKQKSEAET